MAKLDEKYYFKKIKTDRASGVLLHISSLADPYGIGTLGKKSREFVKFLDDAGQTYWQMLPVGPTGYGDSPYQSFSTYAGNPYFVDLDILKDLELLTREEIENKIFVDNPEKADFGRIYQERFEVLRLAYSRFDIENKDFKLFIEKNAKWLQDYVLFMSIKDYFHGVKWTEWPDEFKYRNQDALARFEEENIEEVNFHRFIQFMFFEQWDDLKKYMKEYGILTIGDLPIYVAEDSSDVWANPEVFQLNDNLDPEFVGGCPPDAFSDDGQLWGNPIYNWDHLEETGYQWWLDRIEWNFNIFDCIRLDHFRGFESYWRIPAGDKTAKNGSWQPGPGMKLFGALREKFGDLPIIAEDLGYMTKEVYNFRMETGFPSMKILQFAFDPECNSDYLPHNYDDNCVVYTGTHDNDTIIGWLENARFEEIETAKKYLNITDEETFNWGLIRGAMTSVAKMAIFQMQDLLMLDNSTRMNNPGILGGNWEWRMRDGALNPYLSGRLRELTRISGRLKK